MFEIISFQPKYFDGLLELNKSLVLQWYRFDGLSKREKASWNDLSHLERYLHGGPWNDPETLKIHIGHFHDIGNIDLILEQSTGKIVGEIEYHQSNKMLHIDWMMVHPDYQGNMLGSRLIKHLKSYCNNLGIREIWTEPEDNVEAFYYKTGFTKRLPNYCRYSWTGKSESQPVKFNDQMPQLSKYIYGDATNTREYLQFLFNATIEYADLFNHPYPIKTHSEGNFTVTLRYLSGIPDRLSVIVTSDQEISYENLESIITYYAKSLPSSCKIHTTILGDNFMFWRLVNEFLSLQLILD